MRSVGQRISIKMPEGFDAATSFDDQPIRVNGRRVTPERGGPDQIYVPLTGQNSDEPFLLEIRYAIAGTAKQIDLPEFMDEPAVQKVYLCVYLPYERALVYQSGDWTDEAIDEHTTTIAGLLSTGNSNSVASRMFRRRNENVDDYLKWVMSGVNCDTSANQQFEVDGRPYVFSALRPEPAPAGALHLRTTNMTLLNVIVCAGMVLLGLIMLRARLTTQIAGTLLVIAALVFAGVFFPLVTEHLFSQALLLTAGVIGLVWAISDISRWIRDFRSHRRDVQSAIFSPANFATNVGDIPQSELSADSERANDSPPPAESAGGERGEQ